MPILLICKNREPTNDVLLSHQIWAICYTAIENEHLRLHDRARLVLKIKVQWLFTLCPLKLSLKKPEVAGVDIA